MDEIAQIDKKGEELERQRFTLLQDIAAELSGETTFPTCFDLVIRLRKALQDQSQTIDQIATIISTEPLIPLRLIHLANSALYSRGQEVKDVKAAINRLGLQHVRTTAMAIAMEQLIRSREMAIFEEVTLKIWNHSLSTACAAYVIAKRMTKFNADEAMLAGLVHDLGAFFLLYRFAQYEELRLRPVSAVHLAARWHESIGYTLLQALGIPEEIAAAMIDHDCRRLLPESPVSLADVVYAANAMSGGMASWLLGDEAEASQWPGPMDVGEGYQALRGEIAEYESEMRAQIR
jgi:HD-like signal output (HDOD) protein